MRAHSVVLMHVGRGSSEVVSGSNVLMCVEVCRGMERSGFYYPFEPGLFLSEKWRGLLIQSLFFFCFFFHSKGK